MSLSSDTNRTDALGNNIATVFPYTFKIFQAEDLRVIQEDLSFNRTTLVLNIDYTVSGVNNPAGGNVTLLAGALPLDYKLSIRRVIELIQETDIRNGGPFFPETHEDQMDRHTMADQQQQDEIDRTLKLPETEAGTDAKTTLPSEDERASKFLAFNASGEPIAATTVSGAVVSAAWETVIDDATIPAGIKTIRDALTDEATPAVGDEVVLYDLSATTGKRMTLANLLKAITTLTAETLPDVADQLALYDASAGTADKIVLSDLFKVINGLTNDPTPDPAADYVVTYDASAAGAKKALLSSFVPAATVFATQAEMEAASSTTVAVSPGRTGFHPGVAKAWISFDGTGATAIRASYNVSSITDNGVGDHTVNFTTPFSSAEYGFSGLSRNFDSGSFIRSITVDFTVAPTASAFRVEVRGSDGFYDSEYVGLTFFGDQ